MGTSHRPSDHEHPMPPFPPQIVNVLLSEPRRPDSNDEARALRKRSERSRVLPRRRYDLLARESGVTVSTVRLGDEPTSTA
jgi:hypothetical protein